MEYFVNTTPNMPTSVKLDPLGDSISALQLVRVSGSDLDVVNAARVSFGKCVTKISGADEKLIDYLMQHEHTSPFEHNQLSFRVKAPLFVTRQWMRHRMNSYNEISYRYVTAPAEFYIPLTWRHQDQNNRQASYGQFNNSELTNKFKATIVAAMEFYHSLLASGICREQARAILPLATYTEFIFTCNLHSLTHFLKLRLASGSQYEIRKYAESLLQLTEPYFPLSLQAWRRHHLLTNLP